MIPQEHRGENLLLHSPPAPNTQSFPHNTGHLLRLSRRGNCFLDRGKLLRSQERKDICFVHVEVPQQSSVKGIPVKKVETSYADAMVSSSKRSACSP